MVIFEWIIWVLMFGVTIALLVLWIKEMKGEGSGLPDDSISLGIVCVAPRLIIPWSIILISFLFMDVNKLHLLWICPLVFLLVVNLRVILKIRQDSESLDK